MTNTIETVDQYIAGFSGSFHCIAGGPKFDQNSPAGCRRVDSLSDANLFPNREYRPLCLCKRAHRILSTPLPFLLLKKNGSLIRPVKEQSVFRLQNLFLMI